MRRIIAKILIMFMLCMMFLLGTGCASCERGLKSCNSDLNGGLHRTLNVYSLDGQLLATYEGKIDIDDNANNNSIMFELNGKRYVYYNAIIEVIEK